MKRNVSASENESNHHATAQSNARSGNTFGPKKKVVSPTKTIAPALPKRTNLSCRWFFSGFDAIISDSLSVATFQAYENTFGRHVKNAWTFALPYVQAHRVA